MIVYSVACASSKEIVFENFSNDFGVLRTKKDMMQQISCHNESEDTIIIDSIFSTSSFITTLISDSVIPPKKAKHIPISFTYPLESISIINEQIILYTSLGEFFTTVSAKLTPLYKVTPHNLNLKKVYLTDTINASITIENLTNKRDDLKISSKSISIKKSEIVELDSIKVLHILLFPKQTTGPFNDSIVITTSNPDCPSFTVYLSGEVVKQINPNPAVIDFGKISNSKYHSQSVVLESRRTGKYKITKVETMPTTVYTSISRPKSGDWSVITSIYPGGRIGPFKGVVKLFIDSASSPEIVLPIRGEIIK
jgi:hypothetical protein